MPEYIERERVIKFFEDADTDVLEDYGPEVGSMWGFSHSKAIEIIRSVPTANVEPVRHGTWIHDMNNLYGCSECLGRETMSSKRLKPYCPNCGAKMDMKS